MTPNDLIAFIEKNEAWLTHASDHAGTSRAWRCAVFAQHFTTPDIRERIGRTGFGATAREAIEACMNDQLMNDWSPVA